MIYLDCRLAFIPEKKSQLFPKSWNTVQLSRKYYPILFYSIQFACFKSYLYFSIHSTTTIHQYLRLLKWVLKRKILSIWSMFSCLKKRYIIFNWHKWNCNWIISINQKRKYYALLTVSFDKQRIRILIALMWSHDHFDITILMLMLSSRLTRRHSFIVP